MENAVVVFTRKSIPEMFAAGGTGDWVADRTRVEKCQYVVATRNLEGSSDSKFAHGAGFVIGRILSTVPVEEGRILIKFAEYAEINVRDVWKGNRNPVAYGTVEELLPESDLDGLDWKPFPHELVEPPKVKPLTIPEAKAGLAAHLGIPPDAIEITIHA